MILTKYSFKHKHLPSCSPVATLKDQTYEFTSQSSPQGKLGFLQLLAATINTFTLDNVNFDPAIAPTLPCLFGTLVQVYIVSWRTRSLREAVACCSHFVSAYLYFLGKLPHLVLETSHPLHRLVNYQHLMT